MKFKVVRTDNVERFMLAMQNLLKRGPGMEGMGVLHGRPGEGKTTVITHVADETDAVYVRAHAAWTTTSMLQTIAKELDLPALHRRQAMVDAIVEALSGRERPIFVDEADYLLRSKGEMLDVLRDLYDLSSSPVILIGMEEFAKKLMLYGGGRFRRRITQWVEFAGLTLEDTMLVVRELCEVEVSDDLIEHVHATCEANIGRIVIGISRIETFAKHNRLDRVTLADYGRKRALYFEDPTFSVVKKNGKAA